MYIYAYTLRGYIGRLGVELSSWFGVENGLRMNVAIPTRALLFFLADGLLDWINRYMQQATSLSPTRPELFLVPIGFHDYEYLLSKPD